MKKKIAALLSAFMIVLSLTACGSSLNDTNTKVAESVVNAIDNYLDGYVDADTAYSTLDKEYEKVDKDDGYSLLSTDIVLIKTELGTLKYDGSGDIDYIIEKRNDIAKMAGLKKRK